MAVRKPAADPAHKETENLIKQMEKRISKEYAQAEKEVQVKIDDYFDRFRLKDEKWREWVADGKKTAAEYKQWRIGQMAVGKRWESMKQTIAEDFAHTDQIARSIVKGYMPEVYATNFNYGTYEVEVGAKVNTSFTLYDRQTVERIMRDNPDLLPAPGKKVSKAIAEGKAVRWNKQLIQSVMTQGILQGESIPKLATRLAKEVGDSDRKAAIRNARTMATGAQNAGRVDSYKRAEDMGINMEQEWRATLDMRTRHEHRQLDGQRQKVGDPFTVDGYEILFPGDPSAEGFLVYNCRCTLRGVVAGLEPQARKYRDESAIEGLTYDEWKAQKKSQSNPITLPEEKGEAIAEKYRREYRDGVFGGESHVRNVSSATKTIVPTTSFNPSATIEEAENYAKSFVGGGMNLTGKSISFKGIDIDAANKINERLTTIYENFDIDKLSSLEAFGKAQKKIYQQHQDAPFFATNFGNIGMNATLLKDAKTIDKYIKDGESAFEYVIQNMDRLTGKQLEIAQAYKTAGRSLVGNTVEDMITHEVGHHISYMSSVNKSLADVQKADNWKEYAKNLSGYANHSFGEYVAESFNAYYNGEYDKLQPELISLFDGLRK